MYKVNPSRISTTIKHLEFSNKEKEHIIDKNVMHKPFLKDGFLYYVKAWQVETMFVEHVLMAYDLKTNKNIPIHTFKRKVNYNAGDSFYCIVSGNTVCLNAGEDLIIGKLSGTEFIYETKESFFKGVSFFKENGLLIGESLYFKDTNYESSGYYFAYNLTLEKLEWKYKKKRDYCSSCGNEEIVIIVEIYKDLHCINRKTGENQWIYPVGKNNTASPPILKDNRLFFSQNNLRLVTCLDASSGQIIWQKEYGSSKLYHIAYDNTDDSLLILNNGYYNVDPLNGELNFSKTYDDQYKLDHNMSGLIESLDITIEHVVAVDGFDDNIYAINKKNGEVDWEWSKDMKDIPTPHGGLIIENNCLYYVDYDNNFCAISFKDE